VNCYVGQFAGVKAAIFGDAIVDRYHFGRADRLSPEAPVPVFVTEHTQERDGGAANVARQLSALGAVVTAQFGFPTSIKNRYFVGSHYLFRLDEDKQAKKFESHLNLERILTGQQVVVLSDYAKGYLNEEFCQRIIAAAKAVDVPVIVDPKGDNWAKYLGASVICPNHLELAQFGAIKASVMFPTVVEKCGADGIRVHQGDSVKDYKALNAKPVDVTGAGDTVTAVMALALATSMPMHLAAQLANQAAAIVVGKVGTAVAYASELSQ
jgi:D-beta-D-heptose 7-phosphate kinase/D-beta-D-heptose 1-phosphate adenosyltransferase